MPPHILHPRSKLTSSLFATTLFASFFVVVLPHVLPCPAPRLIYADGDGEAEVSSSDVDGTPVKRRRRRRVVVESEPDQRERDHISAAEQTRRFGAAPRDVKRECPVPKPGGLVGEILGFRKGASPSVGENGVSSIARKGGRPP